MKKRHNVFWWGVTILIVMLQWSAPYTATAQAFSDNKLPEKESDSNTKQPAEIKKQEIVYTENKWWEDFEVHFFVSLPFTALYSYLAVSSLDALVQGKYPNDFRTTNSWIVAGLAAGSSLAIALGSIDRVPDQSQPKLMAEIDWDDVEPVTEAKFSSERMEFIKILY